MEKTGSAGTDRGGAFCLETGRMGPESSGLTQDGVFFIMSACPAGRETTPVTNPFSKAVRADGVCRNHRNLTHDFRMATFHLYDGRARHRTTTPDRDDL